ncbi:uncharacterized protein LOC132936552 [Metopolophium dirhodum]|uniref:uncharacterized protein LOC132936552 n=1 Tax=Metopolophium dirhodum TaxID=44670 RepID=UPI00298F89ED|nr:uncharacterized protein LOC132936552 [Metopolophium dirhodum]
MQCGENVENNPQTSSFSICADNKKDTKAGVSNMKKQLRCTENGDAVNTNRQEEIDQLRAEHEATVLNLQIDHEVQMRNLQIYFQSKIGELEINHGVMVDNLQRSHETLVQHLRNLNYYQGIRQEAALKSMRELKDQMRKDHDQEVQCMQLKFNNLVKQHEIEINDLVEENNLLCTDQESVLRGLRQTTRVFKENMKSSIINYLNDSGGVTELFRDFYNYSSLELSSTYLKQNRTEVEGLQLGEEATIIATHLQTTDGHEDSDADTTTSTIADDDAVDMVKSQDTMVQKTVEDCQKLFYDTAKKLSLLHEYVFRKESNCSTQTDDLQQ